MLAQFAKAGINIDALAAQLQEEGAESFVKSWNEADGRYLFQEPTIKEGQLGFL